MARAKTNVDVRIEGLNRVLRAINQFPKEASEELRKESQDIAARYMAPAYQSAARRAGPWGNRMADSVRVKKDRVPSVSIGYQKRVFSGGASTVQVRYPTHSGQGRASFAPFTETRWIDKAKGYKPRAMEAWGDALTRIVRKWNRG